MTYSLEEDIDSVLQGLKEGEVSDVSDILFGYDNYPTTGSYDDRRVQHIEEELINKRFVIIVEPRGTNTTTNGYAKFRISQSGRARLENLRAAPSSGSTRIYYALSTEERNASLYRGGLTNRGLLGFLSNTKIQDTHELLEYLLTFPKGAANFYTLDPSREKFENRNPISKGTLGFARKKPDSNYHQLHRFFNLEHQYHIYVVNPHESLLRNKEYRDESSDNPIFIQRHNLNGGYPLYFYSNSDEIFFSPLIEDTNRNSNKKSDLADAPLPSSKESTFKDVIEQNELSVNRFVFLQDDERSLIISLNDSVYNFYVNLQDNGEYYTVRQNPPSKNESYLIHDVKEWQEVRDKFEAWLHTLKTEHADKFPPIENVFEETVHISDELSISIQRRIFANSSISIRDTQEIEPALGVDTLSGEIVNILKNIKSEPGNMTGIFGSWGRGKTYLMNKIWDKLDKEKGDIKYLRVRYQAWRYQDTPASWAYLYEQFSSGFLGDKRAGIRSFIRHHWRLIKLNTERDGVWNMVLGIGLFFLAALVSFKFYPTTEIKDILLRILGIPMGVLILISLIKNFQTDYFTKAINLIKKYGVKTSFTGNMGIQAEIQKEFVHLIKAWIASQSSKKQKVKLVLFVDDLDRCKEEKTIEIIDSLRIILDDEEIKDRLIVISAIDERILQMAVQNKYQNIIDIAKDDIVREYIDKLFIFSVKLGPLTSTESQEFFEKFTKNEMAPEEDKNVQKDVRESQQKKPSAEKGGETVIPQVEQKITEDSKNKSIKDNVNISYETINKLTKGEIELFKRNFNQVRNATPRKIRILYYRYLLAKNLLILKRTTTTTTTENSYWLGTCHEIFIQLLIYFSQNNVQKLFDERLRAAEPFPDQQDEVQTVTNVTVSRFEYLELLKILELVIAY